MSPTDRRLTLQPQMVSPTDPRPSTTPYVAVIILPKDSHMHKKTAKQILEPFHIKKYVYDSHTEFIDSLTTKEIPISVIGIYFVSHIYIIDFISKLIVKTWQKSLMLSIMIRPSSSSFSSDSSVVKTKVRSSY